MQIDALTGSPMGPEGPVSPCGPDSPGLPWRPSFPVLPGLPYKIVQESTVSISHQVHSPIPVLHNNTHTMHLQQDPFLLSAPAVRQNLGDQENQAYHPALDDQLHRGWPAHTKQHHKVMQQCLLSAESPLGNSTSSSRNLSWQAFFNSQSSCARPVANYYLSCDKASIK